MNRTMVIHLKNGTVLEILVSDEWKLTADISTNELTSLYYPDPEGERNGLRYIRLSEVVAVFVR